MVNSSQTSSILSESISKIAPYKINFLGKTRLYTHTVNGVPRYTATWGRFLGRWATRFAGPIGIGLSVYDAATFSYTYRNEIRYGMETRNYYVTHGLMPIR